MVFARPAEVADEKFLWAMLFEASHAHDRGLTSPEQLMDQPNVARYVQDWGAAGDLGVVGGTDGVLLGAAWLRRFTAENAAFGYVDDDTPELAIGVAPEGRGTGLGTKLMTSLLDAAREQYDAVSLSVRLENPARRLYERFAFVDVPGSEQINPAGTTSITMLLRLR
ncbi:GNAT family N-acetyltransferase [Nocardia sp. NPDC051981]|uniref:GNAT family N-acetyltransferase n=1 Tax=Nocardia sp. NPDC051981 TaxID=3155417 RepID=UPI003424CE54